ncbi:MAG: sulfurtransferase [Sulfurimonas sp.]|nr:sulfurtransferase [Sulfurimonas sp.]
MNTKLTNILLIAALCISTSLFAKKDEAFFKVLKEAQKAAGQIEPQKLMQMIDDDDDVIILDIREASQRDEGLIYVEEDTPLTIFQITRGNLEWYISDKVTDRDSFIVTYCRSGGRGAMAAQRLRELGYKNATNLKGGLKGWAKAGYPVKTGFGITKIIQE